MEKPSLRVVAMSDLHGILPPSKNIPKCDLLLIGGDICGHNGVADQSVWLHKEFRPWLENLPAEKIVGVAGNHDWIWEKTPHLVPKLPWTYLQDDYCIFKGWKIYGSPWQPRFFDWAFNLDEVDLTRKWSLIPNDTDILVLHGPPQGFGDWVPRDEHVGSPSLTERIRQIKPRLVIYGHIHSGYGIYNLNGSTLANVSIVDERYHWSNQATEFYLNVENKNTTAKLKEIINQSKDMITETIIEWNFTVQTSS